MRKILSCLFLMTSITRGVNFVYAQISMDKYYFEPYMGATNIGMGISPLITGLKGKISNQEMNLDIIVYYHNQYTFRENQIIGQIEGRLISEHPLSSFDPLKRIREDNSLALSNYGVQFREYQKTLQQYRTFQQAAEDGTLDLNNLNENGTEEYIYYYDEDATTENSSYYEEYFNNTQDVDAYYEEESIPAPPTPPASPVLDDSDLTSVLYTSKLYREELKFIAQSINYTNPSNNTQLRNFPTLNYTNKGGLQTNISPIEMEFLIRYEKLKKEYNDAVNLYNQLLQKKEKEKDFFDPADPAEEFSIMFVGLDNNAVWAKKFGLNGTTRYQSYNEKVWYLGYELNLTKKDLRALYNVFSRNKKVGYYIKGAKARADFSLNSQFITAVNDLLDLYVQGRFYTQTDSEFPMMRSFNEEE